MVINCRYMRCFRCVEVQILRSEHKFNTESLGPFGRQFVSVALIFAIVDMEMYCGITANLP